jgi:hypothetical protein
MLLVLGLFWFLTRRTARNIRYLDTHALEVHNMKIREADE